MLKRSHILVGAVWTCSRIRPSSVAGVVAAVLVGNKREQDLLRPRAGEAAEAAMSSS
jgi:hypothetical protein